MATVALWAVAAWQAEALPGPERLAQELAQDPRQTETAKAPFAVTVGGLRYRVEPLHDYAIAGLVVSEHRAESWWRRTTFHSRRNDRLNVKDVCLIWGRNAVSGSYRLAGFSSGEFTCYLRLATAEAARAFDPRALSNNHLLAVEEGLRRRLRDLRRGDQIVLRGYLARYSHNHGFAYARGTSVSRDDTGNGACETLYVSELRLLRPGHPGWRLAAQLAPLGLLAGLVAWFRLPLPPR